MRTAPRVGIAITHHVNRDDVFSVSLVRCSWSVAYCLLAAGHLARQDTRDRARSEVALVVNIMSLLKMMKCQRPVPALNMYAPSAQVFMAGPKPRYVIACLRALERGRACARAYPRYATRLLKQRKEAQILLDVHPAHYYCCLYSISLYGTKLAPSSACVTITYTSVTPCAVLQRLTIQSCRQTASRLKIPLSSTGYCWSCPPRSHLSCTSALLTITCTVDSAIYHQVTQSSTYDHRALRISFVVRSTISARITSTPIRASSML